MRDRVLRLLISENYGCFLMQRSNGGELGRSKSNTAKFNFSLHEFASGPKRTCRGNLGTSALVMKSRHITAMACGRRARRCLLSQNVGGRRRRAPDRLGG